MKSEVKFILLMRTALPMVYFTIFLTLLNQIPETAEGTSIKTNSAGFNYNDFDHRILAKFFNDEYDKDEDDGRVFYSHSMMKYGTDDEIVEKEQVRNMFNDFGIISPIFYKGNHEKMIEDRDNLYKPNDGKRIEEMDFYKMIVGSCQMLVYTKWKDVIPSGVVVEVNYALDIGIPVFELIDGKFVSQNVHVQGLNHKETEKIYGED
jgi:hypothetical protein